MTSEKDATYLRSTILYHNDERVSNLKYRQGDAFLWRPKDPTEYTHDFRKILEEKGKVLVEIVGYIILEDETVAYAARFDDPTLDFIWAITDKDIEEDLYHIGTDPEDLRFVNLYG